MKFALVGAAGYVAPRHMRAIAETGHELIAAFDPHDSVGVLDSYHPDCQYYNNINEFEEYCTGKVDYLSICSPNHTHDYWCGVALSHIGCHAICEKPLSIHAESIRTLHGYEELTPYKVNTIMQLRLLDSVRKLKESVDDSSWHYDVQLEYITPRGPWYHGSWKGDPEKSGGLHFNIGVHLFDLLVWIFGKPEVWSVNLNTPKRMQGYIETERAGITWLLSTDRKDLPPGETSAVRQLAVDREWIDLSPNFNDLHVKSYEEILAGRGFGIDDATPSINLLSKFGRPSDGRE